MTQNNDNRDSNIQVMIARINFRQAILVALIGSITAIITTVIVREDCSTLDRLGTENVDLPDKFLELDKLLKQQDFRAANLETAELMKHSSRQDTYLPCEELTIISRLWEKYSHRKFGFRVQRDIWLNVGGTLGTSDNTIYQSLAEEVGWKSGEKWLSNNELTNNTKAPFGHLPTDFTATRNNDKIYSVIYKEKDCSF